MNTTAIVSPAEMHETLGSSAAGVSGALFVAGLVGLGLGFGGLMLGHYQEFWRGYVTSFAFFLTISLGSLFFVIMQHLTRAGWSVTVRRVAEIFTGAFLVLALVAIPILAMMWLTGSRNADDTVYPWTNPAIVAGDGNLQHKQPYLNLPFLTIRFAFYFLVWIGAARFFARTSLEQDRTGDEQLSLKMLKFSPASMLLFALTLTFCAFDLLMSLEPHWFSTIFGVYVFAGSVVSFHATMAITLFVLQSLGKLRRTISNEHFHDVGKLMFGFTVFWAYIAYSQYHLIWSANLPEETFWFKVRESPDGPWRNLSIVLLFGHFAVPFLLLISRYPKRRPALLVVVALWMLLMHLADMTYLVLPRMDHELKPLPVGAWDLLMLLACFVGIGGLCAAVVIRRMTRTSLVPTHDPRLSESMAFENI